METRANFVLIGSFTLAVIAAAFGFVLWFQSLHTTKARSPLRIIFEGPAAGLRNGGSVNFNGIRVGEVISVKLDNPRRVVALAMVENNAPLRKDTLVGLEFQGLTGVAAISLKGGEEAAPAVPLDEDGVPVLTADPNALQDVTEAIRGTLVPIVKPPGPYCTCHFGAPLFSVQLRSAVVGNRLLASKSVGRAQLGVAYNEISSRDR